MMLDYPELARGLRPETALVAGALAVLGLDLAFFRRRPAATRLRLAAALAALAVAIGLALTWRTGAIGSVFGGVLMLDSLAVAARLGALALTLLVLGFVLGARPPRHPAEYVAILLFATAGFTLMSAAQQLLLAFIALELASLSLYVLAGFDADRPEAAEAALKYFLFGSMAAAFLLFGFSLIFGLTGSIDLPRIADVLVRSSPNPLLAIALVMVLVAFGFKTAAAPFHLWAPDAYQGAPSPSTALIASGSKLAGAVLFVRLFWPGLGAAAGSLTLAHQGGGWLPLMAVLAAASLLLGNLAALAQTNVRRLFAYSAIAHAGVLLLGIMVVGIAGPAPVFYYAATYGLAVAGVFGVIGILESQGGCQSLSDFAGLYRRSPLLALCLLVFILSLAGVPPLAGFFGKFTIFAAALRLDGLSGAAGWLAILGILMSAVALYYYLIVLKQALIAPPAAAPIKVPFPAALALLATALLIILTGVFPSLILF